MTPTSTRLVGAFLLAATLLASCKRAGVEAPGSSEGAPAAGPVAADANGGGSSLFVMGVPSAGTVEDQVVTATGRGHAPALALNDALRKAVMQVNGADVAGSITQGPTAEFQAAFKESSTTKGMTGGTSETAASLAAQLSSYHDNVVSAFAGQVSRFEIVSETQVEAGWVVKARVTIPKFSETASKRATVVVAVPRSSLAAFRLDGRAVPASQVAEAIRARVSQALVESGRVDVLERTFDAEVDAELARMAGPGTNKNAKLRLGQQLAADFVWVASIERFEISRAVQQLRVGGGRTLESLSGGASLSHRLVNVATGQVVLTGNVEADGPRVSPTTLGAAISVDGSLTDMTEALGVRSAREVIGRLFPVVVLSRNGGNLVLSQGRAALREGATYRLAVLGEPLVDPQTGESLGFSENDGGVVTITRASDRVAYGVASDVVALPASFKPGQLQLREEVARGTPAATTGGAEGPAVAAAAPKRGVGRRPAQAPEDEPDVDFDFGSPPAKKSTP